MPRYAYKCEACNAEFIIAHSHKEVLEECKICNTNGTVVKLLTIPQYKIKTAQQHKIGDVTEEFIKEAQKDLRQQKKDLEKQ